MGSVGLNSTEINKRELLPSFLERLELFRWAGPILWTKTKLINTGTPVCNNEGSAL